MRLLKKAYYHTQEHAGAAVQYCSRSRLVTSESGTVSIGSPDRKQALLVRGTTTVTLIRKLVSVSTHPTDNNPLKDYYPEEASTDQGKGSNELRTGPLNKRTILTSRDSPYGKLSYYEDLRLRGISGFA